MAGTKRQTGQLGLFRPESDWRPPTELPDLRGRPLVGIDTETKDDGLSTRRGPGWALGPAGHLCGFSWSAEGTRGYVPLRHPDTECWDYEAARRWMRDLLCSGTRVVFHNSSYDLGWLMAEMGIEPPDTEYLEDTSCMAYMLDESYPTYRLDAVARWQGVEGKDETLLKAAAEALGTDPKGGIWRMPARYVGPYAEQDAESTRLLVGQMEPQLRAQEVWDAYRLEIDLVPVVMKMRARGIRIDVEEAIRVRDDFRRQAEEATAELSRLAAIGRRLSMEDVMSPVFLERLFDNEGVAYPRTPKTQRGSFSDDWMGSHDHWLPRMVSRARRMRDAADKFVQNYILDHMHRGRIHAEVHQWRSEEGNAGTRSQRFSYSSPPLQQMPSPDKSPDLGIPIRRTMLPDVGALWGSHDYSQQEPRLTVHFAAACRCRGADAAVDRYVSDPRTDYHTMVAQMTGKPRPIAKILNLGMTYGKGKRSLAAELGLPLEEAEAILKDYHERLPFIKALEEYAKERASRRGYIRLLDGARMRYPLWDAGWIDFEKKMEAQRTGHRTEPCSREEAERRQSDPSHPWCGRRLTRADTRKALNNLVQGSAARQTKLAMRACWRAGHLPLIQMHDELGFSHTEERQGQEVAEIMRDVVKLRVPMVVDSEYGRSWGAAKKPWAEAMAS